MTNSMPLTGPALSVARSSSGLAPNVAGALAYVLGIITGVIFLVIEKENRFVRFHAAQSIAVTIVLTVVSIGLSILSTVLVFVPVLGWIVAFLLSVGAFPAALLGCGGSPDREQAGGNVSERSRPSSGGAAYRITHEQRQEYPKKGPGSEDGAPGRRS
jgi:uncharacterized membrane protein